MENIFSVTFFFSSALAFVDVAASTPLLAALPRSTFQT